MIGRGGSCRAALRLESQAESGSPVPVLEMRNAMPVESVDAARSEVQGILEKIHWRT